MLFRSRILILIIFTFKTDAFLEVLIKNLNERQKQPPIVFYKKAVLKNFAIFTGKHVLESFLIYGFYTSNSS